MQCLCSMAGPSFPVSWLPQGCRREGELESGGESTMRKRANAPLPGGRRSFSKLPANSSMVPEATGRINFCPARLPFTLANPPTSPKQASCLFAVLLAAL
jgi:hypothetical protein